MKNRQGFVSNSSSSSFMISLSDITAMQLKMIENYQEISESLGIEDTPCWVIEVNGADVSGYTSMDNFDMRHFLINIVNINEDFITWE